MPAKHPLPFGSWPSPVSAELAARGSRRFGMLQADAGYVYWSEGRPEEQGRQVIVRVGTDGRPQDVLPKPFSARSRVHEYGGGEFLVLDATVFFINDKDQQVYDLKPPGAPRRITNVPDARFSDLCHDPVHDRLIAVMEVHATKRESHAQPRNALAAVALSTKRGKVTEIASAHDFYASPRLSVDGRRLAFLAWNLPDMPWDSAALYVADVRNGTLGRPARIAGGDSSAVFQPEWGPDGHLYFTWDKTGWGHLYRCSDGKVVLVHGQAGAELWRPQWVFGTRCYAFLPDGRYAAVSWKNGMPLAEIGALGAKGAETVAASGKAARIDDPLAVGNAFAALVSPRVAAPAVMKLARSGMRPVADIPASLIDPRCVSRGMAVSFKNAKRQTVHGIHYAPINPLHRGRKGALPPALVLAHGGPTSMTDAAFKPRVQFYTSRGFAVLDVNYAGSTGYGRAYRQRLDGQWGIADVADCAAGARFLARSGHADPSRIAIAGGSAGGYTTLMALATTKVFAAGSSHYGISDLALLLEHTHKFESGYLHRLLGTTPSNWKDVFARRSPLNLIDGITSPLILFQGLDDKVVPPEQSRLIANKLKQRGIDVAYHEFAGEGHGFRKAETIIAVLEAELAFLQRVLNLR